jgi:hypothetical protein
MIAAAGRMKSLRVAAMGAVLVVFIGAASGGEAGSPAAVSFPVASVHLEGNVTDGDMEVVIEVKGGDDGLAELSVVAPDGRQVVAFRAPDSSTLGIRQFVFESPEPRDADSLKAAYPEGVYEFLGKTYSGAKLVGKSTLSHRLPATTTFVKPAPAAESVPVRDLAIAWSPVEGVASYVVSIKQSESNLSITARLPSSSTSFVVPHGLLLAGRKYKMAIATVTRDGNMSSIETTFTTEK